MSNDSLPPAAQARLGQARQSGTWTSGLTVDEFAGLRSVGFEPVGQVMGSTVHNLGWWYRSTIDCGFRGGLFGAGSASTITSGMQGAWAGYGAYIDTLYRARHTAMGRMAAECAALGGDGVVAVKLTIAPFQGAAHHLEFQAFGTAVRATGPVRPGRVFLSHVSGQEFVKLIETGWVPVDLVMGAAVGVRHDDWRVNWSTGRFAPAQEVQGWTELVSATRHEARGHLLADAKRTGADGVVVSRVDLRVDERACNVGDHNHDHVVESTILGTAIAEFRTPHRPIRPLTIMRF
ncbi:heavy metal-binding domain-containing protein [Actinoallomurus purpureus]|uniref:heavy metal-binding domain-containing protein n=1 Tax=Actinoallomurus purpureus TaxID=478114 RepID=UPI00209316D2|nr:heavy metal-binding domain-containing protein [Actinoallomurus purpureus]MCO6007538.1 heavy metal-binding domain-containing protein [Actinoallomurus purpureus]